MSASKGPRPITRALDIVKASSFKVVSGVAHFELTPAQHVELVEILASANAASGTTDEKTAQRRAKTVAKKARR